MLTEPYSIYYENRPSRIAFFIDPQSDVSLVDKIIDYNRGKWGGRFNPIILTDGKTISEGWWNFLHGYDPDVICSMVSLGDDLKKKIHVFLSVLYICELPSNRHFIGIDNEPLPIYPTGKNIARIGPPLFDDNNNLILFEVDKTTPQYIRAFIARNFWLLDCNQYDVMNALKTCKIKKYKVADDDSLNSALLDLAEWHTKPIFPSQICSLPNSFKEAAKALSHDNFEIIVGDTIHDLVFAWNRIFSLGAWLRPKITQLWLSNEIAANGTLKPGLGKFIERFLDSIGNSQWRQIHFSTFSLSDDDMIGIKNSFDNHTWLPKTSTILSEHPLPAYEKPHSHLMLKQGLDFHRAHSDEEYLSINEPDVGETAISGGHWFVDLRIQYRPELFKNILNKDYWWQLPRRNGLLLSLGFFNKPARINEFGMFSVLMNRRSDFSPDDQKLVINVPDDNKVFGALFCGQSYDCMNQDVENVFKSRPFSGMQWSDKGKYLLGVLGLFPDLLYAHCIFEKKLWRNIFEKMANWNTEKDKEYKQRISNKIGKHIKNNLDLNDLEANKKWLVSFVLATAQDIGREEIELSYSEISNMAEVEADEFNSNFPECPIPFSNDGLKRELSFLIDLDVLLVGIKPRCEACGYRIWYHINDVNQRIRCRGCGHEFPLPAEPTWYYRLNSLVRVAVSKHGTIPVLISMGQMQGEAKTSAIISPSIVLRQGTNPKHSKNDCELDLVCILDGELVIGEIKQSLSWFKKKDFMRMAEVAKLIKPDKIVFASMEKEPTQAIMEHISSLSEELKELEVKVQWYQINPYVFEAYPVR